MASSQLVEVVEFFHSDRYKKEDWQPIFGQIARLCSADKTFLSVTEQSTIMHRYESCFESESNKKSISYLTLKEKKTIIVNNYPLHKYADKYWVEQGIKSLIAVPISFLNEYFGVLEVSQFSEQKPFSEDAVNVLNIISNVMGMALHKEKTENHYIDILNMNSRIFEIIYSVEFPKKYKDSSFKKWLRDNFSNLSNITGCDAVGFVYPDENIYGTYYGFPDKEDYSIRFSADDAVKDLVAYKMCMQNINSVLMTEDLEKSGIKPSKPIKDFHSALFVPVSINNKTVAAFGFGFKEKEVITEHYQMVLRSFAYYLIFSVIASKNVSKAYSDLSETEERLIESIVLMMEARDTYTKGHSQRVAHYAKKIAEAAGLSNNDQNDIYTAGILHDIGKIGIPDNVLLKPGNLTFNEFKIIKYHSIFSYQIIKDINKFKGNISEYVKYHHERCDGSGYPDGLKCNEIPIGAKILAIADVFDAVTSTRPYRKSMDLESALSLLLDPNNRLDLGLVKKTVDTLRNGFLVEEEDVERIFIPKEIDKIRESIFTTDYVTGLDRRKQFIDNVHKMINMNKNFAIFLIDIINLDYVNYKYSMDVGDKIISYTAKAISEIKNIEYLSRVGSDSFFFISRALRSEAVEKIKKDIRISVLKYLKSDAACKKREVLSNIINFYVTYAEYNPFFNKSAESMIYKCIYRKKRARISIYKENVKNRS